MIDLTLNDDRQKKIYIESFTFHQSLLMLYRASDYYDGVDVLLRKYLNGVDSRYSDQVSAYIDSDEFDAYFGPYFVSLRSSNESLNNTSQFLYGLCNRVVIAIDRWLDRSNINPDVFYKKLKRYDLIYESSLTEKLVFIDTGLHSDIFIDVDDVEDPRNNDLFYLFQFWLVRAFDHYDYGYVSHTNTYPYDLDLLFQEVNDQSAFNYTVVLFLECVSLNAYGFHPYFRQNMMNWLNVCLDDSRADDVIDMKKLNIKASSKYFVEDCENDKQLIEDSQKFSEQYTNHNKYTYRDLLEHLKNYV